MKIRRYGLEKEIARELAAIRARGEPVTLEELDVWYPKVPDKENGAVVVAKALELIKSRSSARKMAKDGSDPVTRAFESSSRRPMANSEKDQIRELLADHQPAISLLHTAAIHRTFRYPFSTNHQSRLVQLDISSLLVGLKLLVIEAGLSSAEGDMEDAGRSMAAAIRLSGSVRNLPSRFVQIGDQFCVSIVHAKMATLLALDHWTDAGLRTLETELSEANDEIGLSRGFLGDLLSFMPLIDPGERHEAYRAQLVPLRDPNEPWWNPDLIEMQARIWIARAFASDTADQLHLIKSLTAFRSAVEVPPYDRRKSMSNAVWQAVTAPGTDRYLLCRFYLPTFDMWIDRDLNRMAQRRELRVALALERFRIDSGGSVPDSLEALVPRYLAAVPADPFTGQPLRYVRKGKGYVVYSVGENLTDEQGAPRTDVSFVVER